MNKLLLLLLFLCHTFLILSQDKLFPDDMSKLQNWKTLHQKFQKEQSKWISEISTQQKALPVKIPIHLVLIGTENGTGFAPSDLVLSGIDESLYYLDELNIEFEFCSDPEMISSDVFYDLQFEEVNTLLDQYFDEKAINIFVSNTVWDEDGSELSALATIPPVSRPFIAISQNYIASGSFWAHEFGHVFGLFHTHEDRFGLEYVNGSNCEVAGDLICDTAADPNLRGQVGFACDYTGNNLDPNGEFYSPDIRNIMSFTPDECRSSFSDEQLAKMNYTLSEFYGSLSCLPVEKPDLIVENAEITQPNLVYAGTLATVNTKVKNIDDGHAEVSKATISLSQDSILDSQDILLQAWNIPSLNPWESVSNNINVEIPDNIDPGIYCLIIKVDSNDDLMESNEANNIKKLFIEILPDICLDSFEPNNHFTEASILSFTDEILISGLCLEEGDKDIFTFEVADHRFFLVVDLGEAELNGAYRLQIKKQGTIMIMETKELDGSLVDTKLTFLFSDQQTLLSFDDNGGEAFFSKIIYELPTNKADLVIQNIETPVYAQLGDIIQSYARVLNKGGFLSPLSQTQVYLSDDKELSADDIQLAGAITNPVYPGLYNVLDMTLEIPDYLTDGIYYLLYLADSENDVVESNESNNLAFQKIIIKEFIACNGDQYEPNNSSSDALFLGTQDEYFIEGLCLTPTDRDFFSIELFGFKYQVQIRGYDELSSGFYNLHIQREESYLTIETSSNEDSFTDTYIHLYGPDGNELAHDDDGAGYPFSRIYIELEDLLPDLTFVSAVLSEDTIQAGEQIYIEANVINAGKLNAGSSFLKYFLSKDNQLDNMDLQIGFDYVNPLMADEISPEYLGFTFDDNLEEGDYYIIIFADSAEMVTEADEENNIITLGCRIENPKYPDLSLEYLQLETSEAEINAPLNLELSVKNVGNLDAWYSFTFFYLSNDGILDNSDRLIGYSFVNPLSPGESQTNQLTLLIPNNVDPGNYYLIGKADGSDYMSEPDELNNLSIKAISISENGFADLRFVSFYISEEVYDNTGEIDLWYSVVNSGEIPSGPSSVYIYFSEDSNLDASDDLVAVEITPALNPGTAHFESIKAALPYNLFSGEYFIIAEIDAPNQITELNENNNIIVRSFEYVIVEEGPDYGLLPYIMNFETGGVDEFWTLGSSNEYGRNEVLYSGTAKDGDYFLVMTSSEEQQVVTNYADLRLNLSGEPEVYLNFWFKDYGDENHSQDGIYLSDDGGESFVKVYDLRPQFQVDLTWINLTLDVDELAFEYNLTLSEQFVIRFQQYDNYTLDYDGLGLDIIKVSNTAFTDGLSIQNRTSQLQPNNDPVEGEVVKIFPNPFTDHFIVENNSPMPYLIKVFDSSGRIVSTEKIFPNTNVIKLSGVPSGIYFVHIMQSNKRILQHKMIKQD